MQAQDAGSSQPRVLLASLGQSATILAKSPRSRRASGEVGLRLGAIPASRNLHFATQRDAHKEPRAKMSIIPTKHWENTESSLDWITAK